MKKVPKGKMARELVYFCVRVLTLVLVWAVVITTIATFTGHMVDLSAVLTFAGGAFGGELLLLAFKRVFADKKKDTEGYE